MFRLPEEETGESDDARSSDSDNDDNIDDNSSEGSYDGVNSVVYVGQLERRSGLLIPSRRPPPDKAHCTVIVMVGLPGSGKTTWVKQYLREHTEEHWILFNADTILSAMAV